MYAIYHQVTSFELYFAPYQCINIYIHNYTVLMVYKEKFLG